VKRLCLAIIDPNGSMYNENKIGPRMEPCGTPQEREAQEEDKSPIIIEKVLFDKYDINHLSAVP